MDSIVAASPRQLARTAGALYLINIVFGAFAIGVVPAVLIVPDVAVTAHNIQTHELLYRLGLVAHVVVTLTNVPMAVIFYDLFKVVNRRLALLDVFFTLVATAVEAAGILNDFTSAVLLGSRHYTTAIPPVQPRALAYLPGDLSTIDYTIYGVFYGFDILCVAYLVYKSTSCPESSASCWRSTPWLTWSAASPTFSHQESPPIWFPGSGCPRLLAKDHSACGSSWPA